MRKFIKLNSYTLIFNLFILFFLLIGIQNSQERKKIIFYNSESIAMPISFIIGKSFIVGSLVGSIVFSLCNLNTNNHKS